MLTITNVIHDIINNGREVSKKYRTLHGVTVRIPMDNGFPISTTNRVDFNHVIHEVLWQISGSDIITDLKKENISVWNDYAVDEDSVIRFINKHKANDTDISEENMSELKQAFVDAYNDRVGPIYGHVWRSLPVGKRSIFSPTMPLEAIASDHKSNYMFDYTYIDDTSVSLDEYITYRANTNIDQLGNLIYSLEHDPYSRHHIITSYIPELLPYPGIEPQENVLLSRGSIRPSHLLYQFMVMDDRLSVMVTMSDMDWMNSGYEIARHALLLELIARVTHMAAYELIINIANCYIRNEHIDAAIVQSKRPHTRLPKLKVNEDITDLFEYKREDIRLIGYRSFPNVLEE